MATVVVAVAVAMVGLVVGPAAAGASGPGTLSLTGHGYGHGHGMGQWGALGYAVAQTPYQAIVGHYYGGTALTPLGSAQDSTQLRVLLTENNGNSVIVTSGTAFSVQGVGTGFRAVMMALNPDGSTFDVFASSSCGGDGGANPWPLVASNVVNPMAVPAVDPAIGDPNAPNEALQLCQGGGNLTVRGDITATQYAGSPRTVNTLPLEQYVAAVVPNESPAGWGALGGPGPQGQSWGFQELEAQAVAVRSYAMATLGSYAPVADICDLSCQTYRGIANEDPLSDLAAQGTAGQVMEFADGTVAATQYSASTGGYTNPGANSLGFPAVPDTGDSICIPGACNPNHTWTATVSAASIESAWPGLGTFESIDVTARNGFGAWGGRVTELTVVGSNQLIQMTGDQFAGALGLNSDWFIATDQVPTSIVAMAATSDGKGYWMVGSNGAMVSYGDATSYGDAGALTLNRPIVGMAATPDGKGYWLVAADGGIFSFGDAHFYGSTGSIRLNQPVVGMSTAPDGGGYRLVAADGGIFSFGDALFYGSTGSIRLNQPVVGMAPTHDGGGYWMVAADGGIFAFGDATFYGSPVG